MYNCEFMQSNEAGNFKIERADRKPAQSKQKNGEGKGVFDHRPMLPARQPDENRQQREDDAELREFDADVETYERPNLAGRRQTELLQQIGKAEPVNQAKAECQPPPFIGGFDPQIFQGDVNDG